MMTTTNESTPGRVGPLPGAEFQGHQHSHASGVFKMKLKDFIAYLERRFPSKAEILDIQISMIADKKTGLVETVTMFGDDDFDGPDEAENLPKPKRSTQPHLQIVS